MNGEHLQVSLDKASRLAQDGHVLEAARFLAELKEQFPENRLLHKACESLICASIRVAENMQETGHLQAAAGMLLDMLFINPGHQGIFSSLRNLLIRQIWQDQKVACIDDARRLGCAHLVPPQQMEKVSDDTLTRLARIYVDNGQPALAEMLCCYLADRGSRGLDLELVRARIRLFLSRNPSECHLGAGKKFLLIKSWGTGFWSEIDNLIGNLLLAEITGRIPVVDWGANNLFCDSPDENAFEQFFLPLNTFDAKGLASGDYSYFSPKWNRQNILSCDNDKLQGRFSRLPGVYYLNRDEDVLVSDYFVAVNELAEWIPSDHPLSGFSVDELYRALYRKYLHLKPEIVTEIEDFWNTEVGDGTVLAAHVRGSDKVSEDANLPIINQLYHSEIALYLKRFPKARIFLLTDSEPVVQDFLKCYGQRLIAAPCSRTSNAQGTHFQPSASRHALGFEVIRDVVTATRCHSFLGYGLSSVSCAVAYLREWHPGLCRLFGAKSTEMRRLTFYNELLLQGGKDGESDDS